MTLDILPERIGLAALIITNIGFADILTIAPQILGINVQDVKMIKVNKDKRFFGIPYFFL